MKRTRKRDRIFLMALGVSFVLHLSMVTLFRIVIYFPTYNLGYYQISIIESDAASAFSQAFQPEAEAAENPARLEGDSISEPIQPSWPDLPSVDLPRMNFSKLKVPSSPELNVRMQDRYEDLFETKPDDLWAQVGEKLSTVGELFTRNTALDDTLDDHQRQPITVGHPAPGFEAVLEWLGPPYTRQVLLAEKIDALWEAETTVFSAMDQESLTLIFSVNREGTVTSVKLPLADEAGIVQSSAEAMKKYQFESLPDGPEEQHGTLVIRASVNKQEGLL